MKAGIMKKDGGIGVSDSFNITESVSNYSKLKLYNNCSFYYEDS